MANLFIVYDLEAKAFRGASSEGKFFSGISSLTLRNGAVSMLDADGNDLLGGASLKNESLPSATSKAQTDIAEAFGVGGKS